MSYSSSSLLSPLLLLQPLNPKTPFSSLPTTLCTTTTLSLLSPTRSSTFSISSSLYQQHSQFNYQHESESEDEEEHVIGDCLVFEQGIFDDPNLQNPSSSLIHKPLPTTQPQIEPQNLIPEDWKQAQQAYNITKQERRKLAQQLQFGSKLNKRKELLQPIKTNDQVENEYVVYRNSKLSQLRPIVLDNPTFSDYDNVGDSSDDDKLSMDTDNRSDGRAKPRNPRMDVYRGSLDDVSEFLKTRDYHPDSAPKNLDGPRKLFTKEERFLLNRRVPDLASATSGKWQPLHTLAASGEFYLLTELLKHNVDINVLDKTGLTAIHRAILGKKQAIFNILLRESANPFVRDEEGATLMHYAVRTASSQMIKILLLYNVDINLQDNNGWTPLHLAVQSRRTDIVRLLLIKGADKTLKNREGLIPLELCLYSGQDIRTYELIKLLKLLPRRRSLSDRKLDSSAFCITGLRFDHLENSVHADEHINYQQRHIPAHLQLQHISCDFLYSTKKTCWLASKLAFHLRGLTYWRPR
ncbi:Aberrant large forked product [Heracleum sosnowskyi]|uniref:Aberrant large forked product n=1 Tax=Heracleum sosnowskyi TaxID=360622 RepID=A0AAD8ILT3_9APIA|nr:Aberrant large forked product [Heracleum sosnowskyi]